jgi:hypothetical protein
MVRPEYPLTPAVKAALPQVDWSRPVERLGLGEESAAYRVGDLVVRVGPGWRTDEEMAWFCAVAAAAHEKVPQALAPVGPPVRVNGHPVTVWPFVDGSAATSAQSVQAARVLAGIHGALAGLVGVPVSQMAQAHVPELDDPVLDAWLADFDAAGGPTHPLHGDYWPGNAMASADGELVAILDWDDAWVHRRERELAHAAWEWGDGLASGRLDGVWEFLGAYGEHGLTDYALRQLVRERLRFEVRYAHSRPHTLEPHDHEFHSAQAAAFAALRPW